MLSQRAAVPVLIIVAPLGFGFLALVLGQDANWDLRNYHWYNPYAFLTGRLDQDIGAGMYYNPLLDIPVYSLAQVLPARAVAFLLGAVQGLNFVLLFALARALFSGVPEPFVTMTAMLVALMGVTGGGHLALVGTTFYDNVVSLAVLGAALVIASAPDVVFAGPLHRGLLRVAAAGLILGTGVGLKLPAAVFAVGLCGALLVVSSPIRRRFLLALCLGLGVLGGIAAFGGHWMWFLWAAYGNPFFPYFNDIIGSDMGLAASYRDPRFLPDSWREALFFPLVFSLDPLQVGEIRFRDYRILIAFLVALATLPMVLWRRGSRAPSSPVVDGRALAYLSAAAGLSYVVWLALFAIYRYLISLEMLAPLLAAGLVALWPVAARVRVGIVLAAFAVMTTTTVPGDWGRLHTWTERFVEVEAPPLPTPGRTLAVITGFAPLAFVIPAFPPEVPFVRLQGYLNHPRDGDTGLNRRVRARVDAYRARGGDIYLLMDDTEKASAAEVLPYYGLAAEFDRCLPVIANLAPNIVLCPVRATRPRP